MYLGVGYCREGDYNWTSRTLRLVQVFNMGICNSKRAIRLDDGGVLLADDSFEVRRMKLVDSDMVFSFFEDLLLMYGFCFTHLLSFRRHPLSLCGVLLNRSRH